MTDKHFAENDILVFDWGDTLMKVFPQYSGPMAEWPQVEAVAGVLEALQNLNDSHPLIAATNAADSGAPQVWAALQRVGMGEFFKAVFTSQELGSRKPELRFYRQIESVLARPPRNMIMIGDSYQIDVLGAKTAGWRAVWYNPGFISAPGALPVHDAEIQHMADLPDALNFLTLPEIQVCLAWLSSRGAPFNLLAHVQLVASAAYLLAVWLKEKGQDVNPVLAHRGGLLHDLAKMDSVRGKNEGEKTVDHAAAAKDLLLSFNQPELAEIANRHMPHQHPDDPRRPQTWEQKLVHFADKLAEGSDLVSLEERMHSLQTRYPHYAQQLKHSRPHLAALQQEICAALEIDPEQMLERLRQELGL
jgi:putative nucleotidyltransferase with HDIG domain